MFEKILVMGRGEVVARVARTCRRIGAETVALYTDAEAESVHVQACDEAVHIGADAIAGSHADVDVVVGAAVRSGCQALHPGYGMIEADPRLPRACERAGITFVGPAAETIVLLRDRVALRVAAIEAGLRVLPGSERPLYDASELRADVAAIGYPIVVKPVFGYGEPDALAVATDDEELEAFLARAEWDGEARYVERWVDRPRHVEIDCVGDGTGTVMALTDREVSVRKDHRRLIAESPAPAIDALHRAEAARAAVCAAASDLCALLEIAGLASVHFLFDATGRFYYVGLRPGLSVEHPLAEMTTNVDLVEAQVRIALGEGMPSEITRAQPSGHAVQTRVEAALDPRTLRPFAARVDDVRWPPAPTGKVRIETGVQGGARVEADHDPVLATVTTYAPTRHEAVLMLDRVVAETRMAPVVTNLRLVRKALNHESFRAGQVDESFLDRAQ